LLLLSLAMLAGCGSSSDSGSTASGDGGTLIGTFVSDKIEAEMVIGIPLFGQDLTSFEFK
jgi:hypothetical protein